MIRVRKVRRPEHHTCDGCGQSGGKDLKQIVFIAFLRATVPTMVLDLCGRCRRRLQKLLT